MKLQVLARFEGFPTKKLESLRSAAALYLKLEETVKNLETWKVVPPLGKLLDKVESFFNKVNKNMEKEYESFSLSPFLKINCQD